MGFEDGAEQSLPRPCHQRSDRSKRTYELTSSIVPRGTSFHGLVEFRVFLLSHLVTCVPYATAASRVHRNSVPSTHMRCMITAKRRASATIGNLRGTLRNFGLKVGVVGTVKFEARIKELVENLHYRWR
jgi:hypothetical protein